jgi:hypothetical protein
MTVDTSGVRPQIVAETEAELARRQGVLDATYDWLEALGLHPRRQSYLSLEAEFVGAVESGVGWAA